MKKLFLTLSALFVACALVACSNSGNTPQAAAKQFFEAMSKGDADTVIKLAHMPDMQKEMGDDKEEQEARQDVIRGKIKMRVHAAKKSAEETGGVTEITASEPSYSNDKKHAVVAVTVKFKNGEKEMTQVMLTSTDAGWKVLLR